MEFQSGVIFLVKWYIALCETIGYNKHYKKIDVIVSVTVSQTASHTIVYLTVYSGADQKKHQSSTSLVSVHKCPVTRKMFLFDDVIMRLGYLYIESYVGKYLKSLQTKCNHSKLHPCEAHLKYITAMSASNGICSYLKHQWESHYWIIFTHGHKSRSRWSLTKTERILCWLKCPLLKFCSHIKALNDAHLIIELIVLHHNIPIISWDRITEKMYFYSDKGKLLLPYITVINQLMPEQNNRYFVIGILKCIFLNDNVCILNKISLKFFIIDSSIGLVPKLTPNAMIHAL